MTKIKSEGSSKSEPSDFYVSIRVNGDYLYESLIVIRQMKRLRVSRFDRSLAREELLAKIFAYREVIEFQAGIRHR